MKLQHYDNFNSIGLLTLSMANKKQIDETSQNDIELGMEQVRRQYSPGFFHTLRKFDYFQKGQHFRTDPRAFSGLDRCVLGKEEKFEPIEYTGNVGQVI